VRLFFSPFSSRKGADLLALPFWQEKGVALPAFAESLPQALYAQALELGDFCGKAQETLLLYGDQSGSKSEPRLMLFGLGERKSCRPETVRRAVGALVKGCRHRKLRHINLLVPTIPDDDAIEALVEGLFLSNFAFHELMTATEQSERDLPLDEVTLLDAPSFLEKRAESLRLLFNEVDLARNLVSRNADEVTPPHLAQLVRESISINPGKLSATLIEGAEVEKAKLGLLAAVGRGAVHGPILAILEYTGCPSSIEKTVIVGKGVTFDTGGLNLKPGAGMETMKCDMAGAAAALATVRAAAALRLPVNVTAVIPSAENAIGSASYKPGDVYHSHAGFSVEIADTDAEGRLILADAISYAQEHLKPTRIIDLATLTGGVVVALGEDIAGYFANDDALAEELMKSSKITHEQIWRLPLVEEYMAKLKSTLADIKNSGGRAASPILGAMFLKQFVKKGLPWAHLDIAGTAYYSEPKRYHPALATGFGVRLLVDYLARISSLENL